MNKGFLVVYNTCNLYRDNVDETLIRLWIDDIQSILEQSFENYHLAISECRGPEKSLIESNPLMDEFIQNVVSTDSSYNIIYENLPMNATFHYTVMEIVKKLGKFEYYMYISSGISFRNVSDEKIDVFKKIYDFLKQNQDIARLNLSAINDNCFPPLSQDYIDSIRTEPYYMKPGYRVNDHCSIYSNDLYEAYNGRLRPDIYIGNGSEPPFSYLTSAINKKKCVSGFISDGDLRRKSKNGLIEKRVKDVMTKKPIYINENMLAEKAINIMNKKKITTLIVVSEKDYNKKNKNFKVKGILHIHTLLAKGIQ